MNRGQVAGYDLVSEPSQLLVVDSSQGIVKVGDSVDFHNRMANHSLMAERVRVFDEHLM